MQCKYCKREISELPSGFYYHHHTGSIYCIMTIEDLAYTHATVAKPDEV